MPARTVDIKPNDNERIRTCFEKTFPLSTYVFSFALLANYSAIGERFEATNGQKIELNVRYPTGEVDEDDIKWIVNEAQSRLNR